MSKTVLERVGTAVLTRTLEEGYGPGAWHGDDLKAAVGTVSAETAFRRPAPGQPQHRGDRAAPCLLRARRARPAEREDTRAFRPRRWRLAGTERRVAAVVESDHRDPRG